MQNPRMSLNMKTTPVFSTLNCQPPTTSQGVNKLLDNSGVGTMYFDSKDPAIGYIFCELLGEAAMCTATLLALAE